MNPMHLEIVRACMAADVMMGHDPDCARWIRRFREVPPLQASGAAAAAAPEGTAAGARGGGAAEARTEAFMSESDAKNPRARESSALVVFTPSGKRGRFPLGTPLLQAARSLGVDVDSVCGGRALCGGCQGLVVEGDFS